MLGESGCLAAAQLQVPRLARFMREEVLIVASIYDRSDRLVGEVSTDGVVTDANQRRVGRVTGVGSVSTRGGLEDASGSYVGYAEGMNSTGVTADICDRNDNYVGKVVGLRSVSGSCYIENRNGDSVGDVWTSHASAVGAALLLLPLIPGQRQTTAAAQLDTGGSASTRLGAVAYSDSAYERRTTRPPRRGRTFLIILAVLVAVGGGGAGAFVLLTRPGPQGSNNYVAVSPDGKFIAAAEQHSVYLWDSASGRLTATLPAPHPVADGFVSALAVNPAGP